MPPEICPNCGAEVPPGAKACPECGSCEETGWSEQAHAQGLGLPDDSFDYEEYVRREFGGKRANPYRLRWYWWAVAMTLILGFFLFFFRSLFG